LPAPNCLPHAMGGTGASGRPPSHIEKIHFGIATDDIDGYRSIDRWNGYMNFEHMDVLYLNCDLQEK
jgi:hypothetical protein